MCCVVTIQGLEGPWHLGKQKIFMELLGCLTCLYSRVGEPCMLQAVCPPTCLCVAHVVARAPQRGTCHGIQQ